MMDEAQIVIRPRPSPRATRLLSGRSSCRSPALAKRVPREACQAAVARQSTSWLFKNSR